MFAIRVLMLEEVYQTKIKKSKLKERPVELYANPYSLRVSKYSDNQSLRTKSTIVLWSGLILL